MATIANEFDPNNPNANANSGGGGTVMPSTGGGAGGGATGGGSTPGSGTQPYQPPNVSQYLAANQGAGQQLTQGITNNVQNQANSLSNTANSASNALNAQYQPLSENLGSKGQQTIQTAFKDPQALLDSYNAAKTASSSTPLSGNQSSTSNTGGSFGYNGTSGQDGSQANPNSPNYNDNSSSPNTSLQADALDQYNQFQQLNSGGYNQAIQNYGNYGQQQQSQLQGQLSNLTQQTGSANNEMGRNQLLQNAVGSQGNYNQGEQTLDSLFLQGSPGQRNAQGNSNLQQLQQNLSGIGNQATQQVTGLGTDIQAKLAALKGLSAQDQSSIKNLFTNGSANGTGLNQIGQNVQNEYNTLQGSSVQDQANMAAALKSGKFTPDQLQQLGLSAGMNTWGVDLSTAGKYGTNALSAYNQGGANQAASADEYARYNALNQLAGGPSGLQNSIFAGGMGQGGYKPISYDSNALKTAIADKQNTVTNTDFKNALNQTLNNIGAPGDGGGTSMGHSVVSDSEAAIRGQIQAGLAAGTLTPEQANKMINDHINQEVAVQNQQYAAGARTGLENAYAPYLNYFNNEYSPTSSTKIGTT